MTGGPEGPPVFSCNFGQPVSWSKKRASSADLEDVVVCLVRDSEVERFVIL